MYDIASLQVVLHVSRRRVCSLTDEEGRVSPSAEAAGGSVS